MKSRYNPAIHHRRSIRLRSYDYSQRGAYFITLCTDQRQHFFGEIEDGKMILSPLGQIIQNEWYKLPERWPHLELAVFQVMPNHLHGILVIHPTPFILPEELSVKEEWHKKPSLGQVVGAYKSCAKVKCIKWVALNDPGRQLGLFWQRDFWDHIIRHDEAYENISEYIINNPANWQKDKYFKP
jgi:putative transposase